VVDPQIKARRERVGATVFKESLLLFHSRNTSQGAIECLGLLPARIRTSD